MILFLLVPYLSLVHPQPLGVDGIGVRMLKCSVIESNGRPLLKRNLLVVVNDPVPPGAVPQPGVDACRSQLSPLLKTGQPSSLLQLLFASLPLRLLALSVCKPCPCFAQHLKLILVHVLGIGSCRLRLRIGVNLARLQLPWIVGDISAVLLALRLVQQSLIALKTLGSGSSNNGSDGSPLGGHQLRQVQ